MARRGARQTIEDRGLDPNGWLITFGDLVTLLLTFFVMLLTMSSMDKKQFRETFGAIITPPDLMLADGGGSLIKPPVLSPSLMPALDQSIATQNDVLLVFEDHLQKIESKSIKVFTADRKVVLAIDSAFLFTEHQAELTVEAKEVLDGLTPIFNRIPFKLMIEGRADRVPLPDNNRYRNLLDLSAQRALNVLLYILENSNVPESRISCKGYGGSQGDPAVMDDPSRWGVEIVIETGETSI